MATSTLPATVEADSAKLGQLSEEVSRIASTLARLAMQSEVAAKSNREQLANNGVKSNIPIETVGSAIRARHLRYLFFDRELFGEPAWDMLLALFHAEIAELRVSISSLCAAAAVPTTTGLRYINTMTDAELFRRRADPHDARRVFVELSPTASAGMHTYFKILEERLSSSE